MPVVVAIPRQMRNGQVITQFIDTVGTSSVTYSYPTMQEQLVINNMGDADITVTLSPSGDTQTIPRNRKWNKTADFNSFSISSSAGLQPFEAWSDEKGAVFDSPEGIYFQSNGGSSGGGGGGTPIYPTLAALQNALPGGSSSPVWVTAENKFYYWEGAVTTPAPSAPSAPAATAANNQVSLTWNSVSGATSYKVYRNGSLLASPSTNSYTDTTAVNGTTYTYTVSAVNSGGESAQSASTSATPAAPNVAPATPTGLVATAGNAQVSLSWSAVSGATSYKVYRNGTQIATPTGTSYTDTGLTNGTAYSYTVSAVNAVGESAVSSAQSATPAAPPVPATPAAPTATVGDGQVALTWAAVSGATSYKVYRNGTNIGSPTTNSYTDTGLTNGTAYSYTISAVNASGESAQSSATSATPQAPAQTGKVDDASLIRYADAPAINSTLSVPSELFGGTGAWTFATTIRMATTANTRNILMRTIDTATSGGTSGNSPSIQLNFEHKVIGNFFGLNASSAATWTTIAAGADTVIDPSIDNHLVFVRDATTIKFYLNNVFIKSAAIANTVTLHTNSNPLTIGGNATAIKNYAYYNRALTTQELTQNYNALK